MAAINARGSRETGRAEIAITGRKIVFLIVLVAAGAFALADNPDPVGPLRPFLPEGIRGVLMAMGLIFIAFEGYEIIVQTSEEIIAPRSRAAFVCRSFRGGAVRHWLAVSCLRSRYLI